MKTLAFCRVLWYNVCMENKEVQTSNTEEMVTISRAEYERLQQENAQMEATRVRLEAERIKLEAEHARLEAKLATLEQEQAQVITSLTLQNEWLLEQLKLSKKKLFGRSSEQAEQLVMDQLSLTMNEAEAYKQTQVVSAQADASRYAGQILCYKAAPKQYMLNSYFDAMEIGGSQARKFVVTGNADNEVLWLNLERKVRSGLLDLNLSE